MTACLCLSPIMCSTSGYHGAWCGTLGAYSALTCAEVEFVLLEDCGHFWQEQAEAFFERVRAFLERVE